MPYVRVATNVRTSEIPADFEARLVDILHESMVGKPKNRIMIDVESGKRMIFGEPGPVAHINIRSIGAVGHNANIQHTERVTAFISETLGVAKDKMIIMFDDMAPHLVGFNGTTVEDAMNKE